MKLIGRRLLDAQTVADAAAVADLRRTGPTETTHYIRWNDGVSVGAVAIESAAHPDYTGTWSPVETVTFDGEAPKVDHVRVSGAYSALRHRIVTPLNDGGTVTTKIEASA